MNECRFMVRKSQDKFSPLTQHRRASFLAVSTHKAVCFSSSFTHYAVFHRYSSFLWLFLIHSFTLYAGITSSMKPSLVDSPEVSILDSRKSVWRLLSRYSPFHIQGSLFINPHRGGFLRNGCHDVCL